LHQRSAVRQLTPNRRAASALLFPSPTNLTTRSRKSIEYAFMGGYYSTDYDNFKLNYYSHSLRYGLARFVRVRNKTSRRNTTMRHGVVFS
jgi:hypothetical protein